MVHELQGGPRNVVATATTLPSLRKWKTTKCLLFYFPICSTKPVHLAFLTEIMLLFFLLKKIQLCKLFLLSVHFVFITRT